MPSIRVFKSFLAVAAEGSFTAAANRVALTQAAVGLQMRTLERDLRQTLFHRHGKVVSLNEQGRALLPLARQMVRLYEQMLDSPHAPAPMTGTAHLGAVVSALPRLVRATLELKQQHPALDLHVSAAKSTELLAQIEAGELDAAIVVRDPAQRRPDLAWTPLYAEPMVLLAPRDSRELSPKAVIEQHPFIRFDPQEHTGQLVERTLRRLRARPSAYLELNSIEAIADLVRSSLGVAVLPCVHRTAWARDPELRMTELPSAREHRQIELAQSRVTPKATLIAAIARAFQAQVPLG